MAHSESSPGLVLVGIVFAIGLGVVCSRPASDPVRSLEETAAIIKRLNLSWSHPGKPVLVFSNPHCRPCNSLEAELKNRGIPHLRVDVTTNPEARKIHKSLGLNALGSVATLATPTTLVGTKVIRGNNIQAILAER